MNWRVDLDAGRGQPSMSHFTVEEGEQYFLGQGEDLVSLDEAEKLRRLHHVDLLTHEPGWRCTVEVDRDPTFGHVETYFVLTNEFAAIVRHRKTRLRGTETLVMQRKLSAEAMRAFVVGDGEIPNVVHNFFDAHKDKIFEIVDFDLDTVEWAGTDGKVIASVIMSYDYADLEDSVKFKLDRGPVQLED